LGTVQVGECFLETVGDTHYLTTQHHIPQDLNNFISFPNLTFSTPKCLVHIYNK